MTARPLVLAIAGSLRTGSLNRKLLAVAVRVAEAAGAEIDLVDLRELALPIYDGDVEAKGVPPNVTAFKQRLLGAQGLLIASPEYNNSVPGGLKNAIDWASRPPTNPFREKFALVMGASPGKFGAARGNNHLRQVLMALGVWIVPSPVLIPVAHEAFDEKGELKEAWAQKDVARGVETLLRELRLHATTAEPPKSG